MHFPYFDDTSTEPAVPIRKRIIDLNIRYQNGFPMFRQIELNMLVACNRSCSFCPVSDPDFYKKNKKFAKLELPLYKKILDDLALVDYSGILVFSGLSEPLLLKDICEYIELAKTKLPSIWLEINTNGDVLNIERLGRLFDSGLDALYISMYDGSHQIEKFTKMGESLGLTKDQLVLRRRYLQDGNYGLVLSNRSGLLNTDRFVQEGQVSKIELPLQRHCYYPFYMMRIDHEGQVLMCPHDWDSHLVLGSVKEQSVWDIWIGDVANQVRKKLSRKDRNFLPCNNCDVQGDLMGGEIFMPGLICNSTGN